MKDKIKIALQLVTEYIILWVIAWGILHFMYALGLFSYNSYIFSNQPTKMTRQYQPIAFYAPIVIMLIRYYFKKYISNK